MRLGHVLWDYPWVGRTRIHSVRACSVDIRRNLQAPSDARRGDVSDMVAALPMGTLEGWETAWTWCACTVAPE